MSDDPRLSSPVLADRIAALADLTDEALEERGRQLTAMGACLLAADDVRWWAFAARASLLRRARAHMTAADAALWDFARLQARVIAELTED